MDDCVDGIDNPSADWRDHLPGRVANEHTGLFGIRRAGRVGYAG